MDYDVLLHFSEGQKHLVPTFEHYLALAEFNPKDNSRVLNIGCGNNCIGEFLPLSKIYRTQFDLSIELTCVDQTEEDFSVAKNALGDMVKFIPGDAQNIPELVDENYGLVVIRAPDLDVSRKKRYEWDNILLNTKQVLAPNALVLMTHLNEGGYINLIASFHDTGYNIVLNELNKFPGPVLDIKDSPEEMRFDKYVVIGKT